MSQLTTRAAATGAAATMTEGTEGTDDDDNDEQQPQAQPQRHVHVRAEFVRSSGASTFQVSRYYDGGDDSGEGEVFHRQAVLEDVVDVVRESRPADLRIATVLGGEWQNQDVSIWKDACRDMMTTPPEAEAAEGGRLGGDAVPAAAGAALKNFRFSAESSYRLGQKDNTLVYLLPYARNLQSLEIVDGLVGYTDTFRLAFPRLGALERLRLSDASRNQGPLNEACCEALAFAIRSFPKLRSFHLSRVRFESKELLGVVLEALHEKSELEVIQLLKLSAATTPSNEFHKYVVSHPVMIEHGSVMGYLNKKYLHQQQGRPYGLSERLEAVLRVSPKATTINSAGTRSSNEECTHRDITDGDDAVDDRAGNLIRNLSIVNDRVDLTYQLLRKEFDPTRWAAVL